MKKREILFSAVLTGVLLAGCGNSGTKETVGPANGAQETQIENQIENEDNVQNEDIKDIAERIQKSYDICGFIREIDDGKVVLDAVEFITPADTDRMAELGLTEADFPNGYYIHNEDENTDEYTLSEDTEYNFIDWNRNFAEDDTEDLKISTKDSGVFEEYLKPYLEKESKIPFFFELDGNQVGSITEEELTSM